MPMTAECHIPKRLKAIGMREAHSFPLVSRGKRDGRFSGAFRKPAKEAWRYPSIELRSATAWTAMVLDCDTVESVRELHDGVTSQQIPWPNWITERPANQNCHAVWLYRDPILRGDRARPGPQSYGAHVNEFYRHQLRADPGYRGVLSHNPLNIHRGRIVTHWGNDEPYELDDLAQIIPLGWTKPELATTGIGRNCALFDACMRWAGSPKNVGYSVLPAAMALNQSMDDPQGPLPASEVRSIARSVERYRRIWASRGQFDEAGDEVRSAWGRACNRKSIVVRRAKNSERDAGIIAAYREGHSVRRIASETGLSKSMVWKVIRRDRDR